MTFANTEARLASKNVRNAVQRVEALEERTDVLGKDLGQIADSANKVFGDINRELTTIKELLRAVAEVAGMDAVEQVVTQNRTKDDELNTQKMAEQIDSGLSNGDLVPATEVRENSLIVFLEKDKDGKSLQFGARKHFMASQLLPEFRAQLANKGIGATVTAQNGNVFEVTAVYDVALKVASPTA
jgi:uncharacterized protein YoxC